MTTLTVTPAYGRDYKSAKSVRAAWDSLKDFRIANPVNASYINKLDAKRFGVKVYVRYDSLRKIVGV